MKILFYYDPVTHKADSMWRAAHLTMDVPLFCALRSSATGGRTEARIMTGPRYLATARQHGIAEDEWMVVDPSLMTAAAEVTHEDLNRLAYEGTLSVAKARRIADLFEQAMAGFRPDIVITWTPAPYFKEINPDILILHKEMSVIQRNPFPATFFLDPIGCYTRSLLYQKLNHPASIPMLPESHVSAFERLRSTLCRRVDDNNPLAAKAAEIKKRFSRLLLVPLQYNGSFSFDGLCPFRSQYEFAESVLQNVPAGIGVIITPHTYGLLTPKEQDHLADQYPHAVFLEEAAHYQSASDMLLSAVDGVVAISSTIGLKALLWRKKLITIGTPYLGCLDDATSLDGLEATLTAPYDERKDNVLAWLCLLYSFPLDESGSPGWAEDLLGRILRYHRDGRVDEAFDLFHGDIEQYVDALITRSEQLYYPASNVRPMLDSRISRLSQAQMTSLMRSLDAAGPSGSPDCEQLRKDLGSVFPALDFERFPLWKRQETRKPRVVFLYAAARWRASGPYLQDLCRNLVKIGLECMIVAEGEIPEQGHEDGVLWRQFSFEESMLSKPLKREIIGFSPDVLVIVNVRFRPMRAAIELHMATGAKLVIQSEDDDSAIYQKYHPKPDPKLLEILDKPEVSQADIAEFLGRMNWDFTLDAYRGRRPYRDVEPLLRILCYRMSSLHTSIWYPVQDRLVAAFGKPAMVLPPVIEMGDYSDRPYSRAERARVLERWKINPEHLVVFLGGTIYFFSPEFETFLRCLNMVSRHTGVTLVITGRSAGKVDFDELKASILSPDVPMISLGSPPDDEYLEMMAAADVIAAPGYPDTFNRNRLSSRLVKAMALAKPVFTYECGFGESLRHGENAILTLTEDPEEWAHKLLLLRDPHLRRNIGMAARVFAEQHFDAYHNAVRLAEVLSHFVDDADAASDPEPPHVRVSRFLSSFRPLEAPSP